jgi:Zn-dependent protease/CBS domain-containing protein
MRSWSFPVGRVMGVQIRIHLFFLLLLACSVLYTNYAGISPARGVMLWVVLLMAVVIREAARGLVAVRAGLEIRNLLLLPIGGLFTHQTPESSERASEGGIQTRLAVVGPMANLLAALTVAGLLASVSPVAGLIDKPWVTPLHLMRSFVWLNVFLAAVNMFPAYPMDAGKLVRGGISKSRPLLQATKTASGIGQALAFLTFAAGLVLLNPWLIFGGMFIFLAAHLEDQGVFFQAVVDTIQMKDVMLTEFSTLSPADTLEYALQKAMHSLQEDFPVVRGDLLVGVVSRQLLVDAMQTEGNGYVQSVMTKAFQVAKPGDTLGTSFRRISGGRGLSLVPVMEGDRVVGIVTLQNLMHSMGLLAETRRIQRAQQMTRE